MKTVKIQVKCAAAHSGQDRRLPGVVTHSRLWRATSVRSRVGIVLEDGSRVAIDWVTSRSYSSARRRLNVQSHRSTSSGAPADLHHVGGASSTEGIIVLDSDDEDDMDGQRPSKRRRAVFEDPRSYADCAIRTHLPNKRPEVQLDIVPDEVCELDGCCDILGFVTPSVDKVFHPPLVVLADGTPTTVFTRRFLLGLFLGKLERCVNGWVRLPIRLMMVVSRGSGSGVHVVRIQYFQR